MFFSEIKKLDQQYIANTYKRAELDVESASGAVCRDLSGRELIDFSSGIGVNSIGYTNPRWVAAVKNQLDLLTHMSNLYYTQPQVALAKALCERAGMERVFFANSGAEANECAIKAARKYAADKYGPERCEIVTLINSFHGRTIATLAATGQDGFHKSFGPFPPGFIYAKAGDIDDLRGCVSEKTAAVMIELIQGEGGVVPLDGGFVAEIARLCAEKDILLVTDEVQTGVGRTGKFLCGDYFGLKPDIITLAKGLGGGLPIGAALFGPKTKDTLGQGDHGSTFGGNPVVCAGALEVLNMLDGKFLDSVAEKGAYLAEKLACLPGIAGVTGKGLMLGAELDPPLKAADIAAACAENGLIVLTAKAKLRFLPPLTIKTNEIDRGLAILAEALAESIEKAIKLQEELPQ